MLVFETTFKNGISVEVYDDSDQFDMKNYMVIIATPANLFDVRKTNSPREVFTILNTLQALEVEV